MTYDGFILLDLNKKRLDATNIQSRNEFMTELMSKMLGHNNVTSKPDVVRYDIRDGRFEIRSLNPKILF